MSSLRVALVVVFVVACAKGGAGNPQVDASPGVDSPRPPVDAPTVVDAPVVDAPVIIDAPVMIDAMVDAGNGLFCSAHSQCGPGTCCYSIEGNGFCGPGTVIFGACIPPLE